MTLLTVHNLTMYYGADLILDQIGFQVSHGEKLAIVGVNGAGKSTLLKIIGGLVTCDEGEINITRGHRVAYLPQEACFEIDRTLWQEMEAAFAHLKELQAEMRTLEERLSDQTIPDWEDCMQRYGEITARFEHAGGYQIEQRIEYVLHHLGFTETHHHQPLAQFSGGQKTRAALAAILLSDPDLLLLDEPTNHLDLQALEWLDGFLQRWDGTLIVVSHDRYFLDKVTNRTLEITNMRLEDYPAGYNHYLVLKAERLERRLKEYEAQQEMIARTEEFIRRYKAGQRSKEAKGREKRLERYKEDQMLTRPEQQKNLKLNLNTQSRSGDMVLSFHELHIGYANGTRPSTTPARGNSVLFTVDGLEMRRGERVALIGPNGSGKTTLLRTLVGDLQPIRGTFRLGHNVVIGYYAQGHESLNMQATILDEILRINPQIGNERARTLLGRFLFYEDDVFKRIKDLSGGERNRVALAQLTLQASNVLIMDEPTNHLDINARESLEDVLNDYPGTLFFVSHDRFFIDALADKLWIIEHGQVIEYLGSYSEYQQKRAREQERATEQKNKAKASAAANASQTQAEERKRKKRQTELESEIERIEQELAQVKQTLERASADQDVARITSLGEQYVELEARLEACYDEWATLF